MAAITKFSGSCSGKGVQVNFSLSEDQSFFAPKSTPGRDVTLFVEHCEAVVAKIDVNRRWLGEQGRRVSIAKYLKHYFFTNRA